MKHVLVASTLAFFCASDAALASDHQAVPRKSKVAHPASVSYALASWYHDAGDTASGYHVYYGVANKTLPFGTQVSFLYHGRRVTAVVDDRGPYVGSRMWDFNQNTAAALRFKRVGVDMVGYRVEQ